MPRGQGGFGKSHIDILSDVITGLFSSFKSKEKLSPDIMHIKCNLNTVVQHDSNYRMWFLTRINMQTP